MNKDFNELYKTIILQVSEMDYIKADEIPNIALYMDQVTTFMEEHLSRTKRYPDDKLLTKTMINNYAKNHLLPAPEKKKYTKEHILLLTYIYYFKNFISIKDIDTILDPITQKYFSSNGDFTIEDIYTYNLNTQRRRMPDILKNIQDVYEESENIYDSLPELNNTDREYLRKFAFICDLSFDIYVKKMILEKLIDTMPVQDKDKDKKKKK